jgi:hypothetical protein
LFPKPNFIKSIPGQGETGPIRFRLTGWRERSVRIGGPIQEPVRIVCPGAGRVIHVCIQKFGTVIKTVIISETIFRGPASNKQIVMKDKVKITRWQK